MIGKVNCTIYKLLHMATAVVVFWREAEAGILSFEPVSLSEDGEVSYGWKEYTSTDALTGAFRIPMQFARTGILQELVDELAKEFQVVASEVQEAKSKEQAVQAHLEDLQKLLFTSDWIELQRGDVKVVREDRSDADI